MRNRRLRAEGVILFRGNPPRANVGYGVLELCTEQQKADPDDGSLINTPVPTDCEAKDGEPTLTFVFPALRR